MINTNRIARGLLDWMQDSRPVVDRATMLPIGQYEDGSLTLAWPGFLKDAAEGAQRTLLDAARVPVPDAPTGTRWASNVDALNAASIAPMAGVAGRAAGAIPRGTVASGGSDVAARLSEQPTGFRAYHGSPHNFRRFDLSKIGTGEGAQAYGHGLYFAEAEDVARMYRDKLSKGRRGRMYEVNIKADPDRFLDWDKPFAEQSPAVQDAMRRAGFGPHYENFGGKTVWPTREAAEEAALRHAGRRNARPGAVLVERDGGYSFEIPSTPMKNVYAYALREPEVASALREAGIPGVRYLDAGSRGAGEGSRNYVVFDDSLIDILRKYANPDTAALPALFDYALPPGGLLAPPEEPPLPGLLQQEPGLRGNMFGPPPPKPPLRMWPPEVPDERFWQRFHDEQIYKGIPREDIPPLIREHLPLEVPGVEPVFPDDRWGRLITWR